MGNQVGANATNMGNNLMQGANATASGIVGGANAISGGLSGGYNNYLMQQILGKNQGPTYTGDSYQDIAQGGSNGYIDPINYSNNYG